MLTLKSLFESRLVEIVDLTERESFCEALSILDALEHQAGDLPVEPKEVSWFRRSIAAQRGYIHAAAGNCESALKAYAEAQADAHPYYASNQQAIANIHHSRGDSEGAIKALDEGLRYEAATPSVRTIQLLMSYIRIGRADRLPYSAELVGQFETACRAVGLVRSNWASPSKEALADAISKAWEEYVKASTPFKE